MTFEHVGIIGAGTMGAGIAINLASEGIAVTIIDQTQEAVDRAISGAGRFYDRAVEKGRMQSADADAALTRLSGGPELEAVAGKEAGEER